MYSMGSLGVIKRLKEGSMACKHEYRLGKYETSHAVVRKAISHASFRVVSCILSMKFHIIIANKHYLNYTLYVIKGLKKKKKTCKIFSGLSKYGRQVS